MLTSFAKHAPQDTLLVIKQHPLDRGYRNYSDYVATLAAQYHLGNRVRYIHDQHLPTLLEHARGVVVVNSTVGLSALHHGTPTKVCGEAIYDLKGLTFQGRLHAFWKHAAELVVDAELYIRFRSYLVSHTQLNGNFYRRLTVANSEAGLVWPSVNQAVAAQVAVEAAVVRDLYLRSPSSPIPATSSAPASEDVPLHDVYVEQHS